MNKLGLSILIVISLGLVSGLALLNPSDELNLNIPIVDMKGRVGKCQVEVLDIDDDVIGSAYRFVFVSKEHFSVPIKIKLKKKVDDYDLLRVKVTFRNEEMVYSLHQLQDRMIVKILGQNEFIKGTPINYRIIVCNQRTNEPLVGAAVEITLKETDGDKNVFKGSTDRSGTCKTDFLLPEHIDRAELHFEIVSDIGQDAYDISIKFLSGNLTYLVTDKPIYQPGQTIHIRTLSLRKPNLVAVDDGDLVFEIEDSKGNKVFKESVKTDKFGTGYVQFLLADEVNFGDYTIRAILAGEKIEKTVKVEKYVLPKFRITLTADKEFYLPGERMEGDIDVQYFFGKPVAGGKVKITTYRYDIGFQKEAVIEGATDSNGNYHFTYDLPDYFVGEPLEKGDAFIRLDIDVIDKANHSEKISTKKKIVQDILSLSIVPEGGVLRPQLENRIYVLVNYPDGSPCVAHVEMTIEGKKMTDETDEFGIAEFLYIPRNSKTEIIVDAKDEKGEMAQLKKQFALDIDRDQIIMRMERGIYKVGDAIDLQLLTTKKSGRVYIDVIKDNQTVLTKSVNISNGKGNYKLGLTPDIAGSVWLHAYIVTPGGDIVRDTRFCYVHSADDLSISIKGDKDEYLPGGDGQIIFTVNGKDGKPRVAALCIAVVDEAVFAVSELQPGLEKVYFTLEKEIMEPRYEIHGFEPEKIVKKPGIEPRAENVMFSTLEPKEPFPVDYTTPQEINEKILTAFSQRLMQTRDIIYSAINQYYAEHNEYPKSVEGLEILLEEGFLRETDIKDPWARRYRVVTRLQEHPNHLFERQAYRLRKSERGEDLVKSRVFVNFFLKHSSSSLL